MENSKKPYTCHLFTQSGETFIFVDSSNRKVLLKTIDAGVNISTYTTRSDDIMGVWGSMWIDRANAFRWFAVIEWVDYGLPDFSGDGWPSAYGDDIFYMNSTYYALCDLNDAGTDFGIGIGHNASAWAVDDIVNLGANTLTIGKVTVVGTTAYFLVDVANTTLKLYKITGGSITELLSLAGYQLDFDTGVKESQHGIAYDDSDNLYFIAHKNGDGKKYLQKYNITGDTLTELGEYNVILMLDRNCAGTSGSPWEFEKACHVSDPFVYQIARNASHLFKIQDLGLTGGETIIAVTDKYLITSNADLYEYTNSFDELQDVEVIYELSKVPRMRFSISKPLSTDTIMEIFEVDD